MVESWLDFYPGGVPALDYFLFQVRDVEKLAKASTVKSGLDTTAEMCLIGLAAYFEAFCKNQFAAIINICPKTLIRFTEKRDCRIAAGNLLHVLNAIDQSLGFLISEEYDFGSAKAVNSLYYDLLGITPFSKRDAHKYALFLNDRNLLVHHGGIVTAKYKSQKLSKNYGDTKIYWDSLVIGKTEVLRWSDYIKKVATKLGEASRVALTNHIESGQIAVTSEHKKGISALGAGSPPIRG